MMTRGNTADDGLRYKIGHEDVRYERLQQNVYIYI